MPRTVREILEHADELARWFESLELDESRWQNSELYDAVQDRAAAERLIASKVAAARASGTSWAVIGGLLRTSGEAARQRYGAGAPTGG